MRELMSEANSRLTQWVRGVLGDVAVSELAPGEQQETPAVSLYMLRLGNGTQPPQSRCSFQVTLHYLVTTWADDLQQAHDMLLNLTFSAMESADYDVELNSLPLSVWKQFGIPPRPAFILQAPLEKPQPSRPVEPVKEQVLKQSPISSLAGKVVYGPGDISMPNVRVELPELNRSTVTDQNGVFRFGAVPAGQKVRLRIRGQEFAPVVQGQSLVFHLEPNGGVTCQPT